MSTCSTSSGSSITSSAAEGSAPSSSSSASRSGRCRTIPSSEEIASASSPKRSRHPRGQRERPGGVHAPAVGREHAQPPVADLVAEALEHDRALARQHPRRGLLLAQIGEQVARGARVEVVVALQRLRVLRDRPARELADRLAQLLRAADRVALPERHRAGRAGGGRDDHTVAADLLDPPAGGAEQERLPGRAPRRPSPRRARRRAGRRAA